MIIHWIAIACDEDKCMALGESPHDKTAAAVRAKLKEQGWVVAWPDGHLIHRYDGPLDFCPKHAHITKIK